MLSIDPTMIKSNTELADRAESRSSEIPKYSRMLVFSYTFLFVYEVARSTVSGMQNTNVYKCLRRV